MKLVYKFKIKENKGLSQLCLFSNNLYNQANYIIKKELNNNHKWIRYNQLYKIMKEVKTLEGEINFYKLKTQTSQ